MQIAATSYSSVPSSSQKVDFGSQSTGLGQDAFMMLLLAQFKNQDPLKPMEDREFIAQLAQFNSLSQLMAMNETLNAVATSQAMFQGSALIGKTISGITTQHTEITGIVSGLRLVDGRVILEVNGESVPLELVYAVRSESEGEG